MVVVTTLPHGRVFTEDDLANLDLRATCPVTQRVLLAPYTALVA